ncbi:MAG: nucleotidyltransferase domain-containing protein [Nitrospinae bacterium]|nr:nucleotidyltransferase domain-containing protein [Nitrospinota bacterium]
MDKTGKELTVPAITPIELLRLVKGRLLPVFGARLKGVVLYGSRARGDAKEDSDYDFLVLLEGPIDLDADISIMVEAVYDLVLEFSVLISTQPADINDFESGAVGLYRNAKREGIFA